MPHPSASPAPEHKPRPLIDLLVSVIVPSVILMQLSTPERLGAVGALVTALALPLAWGIAELVRYRKFNFIALLGVVSVLLTGGIGLLEIDPEWLAIKEAAIPGIIGLAVLGSTYTRYPLVKTLLFNPAVINTEAVRERLAAEGNTLRFETRLVRANYFLAGTFAFSSAIGLRRIHSIT